MYTVRHRLVRRNLDSVPVLESYGSLMTDNNQEKDIICMLETLKNMFFYFFHSADSNGVSQEYIGKIINYSS